MGNRYIIERNNITPTAGQDVMTYVTASGRRARLVEVVVTGQGSSSAAQRLDVGRSTGGTTGSGAITPDKFDHTDQPAAAGTLNTTWSGQPTIGTNVHSLGFNALGGCAIWKAPGGKAYEARNGENISIRCPSGAPTPQACSVTMVIEED